MRRPRTQLAAVIVASLALPVTPALAAQAAGCADPSVSLTVEERRAAGPVPQEILRRSGFDTAGSRFARALCRADSYRQARDVVTGHGQRLWQRAVERAQGRGPAGGDLSRADDRPLYWARLEMTAALRQWQPGFALPEARRAELHDRLERGSRGQDAVDFPGGRENGPRRVLVTGFDPFTLDRDIRISNPSGATALALDGTVLRTAAGPVRIETAMFPVRWADFTRGTVERALRPHLPQVDLFATVSQGRPGQFDIERFNGAWRGASADNDGVSAPGPTPVPGGEPPQWTVTTLPHQAVTSTPTGRFPVRDNTQVVEVPAGADQAVTRPGGPTEGSTARQGGGGDYLSNEIAYRATLLRDRLGLDIPGGHVHTPVLEFGAGNEDPGTGRITDPEFLRNRQDIIDQVRSIIRVAAEQDAVPDRRVP
ncbi:pyroglutamyl peptidase [Streptomyces zingiberis]|nr:pyroglutamyl peptidase [Streptomyces zingiberis]